jgi:SulP family sulfate permease
MTVMIDMVAGVVSGLVVACLLFLKRMSEVTHIDYHHAANNQTEHVLPHGIMLLRVDGPLFFGTAEKVLNFRPEFLHEECHHIILDMSSVPVIDVTALDLFAKLVHELESRGKTITLCLRPNVSKKIALRLGESFLSRVRIVSSVNDALAHI